MFPSGFWLILGIINFACAALPPYRPFSLVSLMLALMCFYFFAQARKAESGDDDDL